MIFSYIWLYICIITMGCTVGKEDDLESGTLDSTLLPKPLVIANSPSDSKPFSTPEKLQQEATKTDTLVKQPKYKTKIDSRVTSKYEIKALIGKGSFSDVLRVDCRTTKQPFAVKVLKVRNEQEEDLLNAELSVLKTITHRYIIHLEEVIISKECTYLIMELATGGELYDRIKSRGRLEEAYSCNITQMILEGLTYLHNHGVTHRDLKPENLLFYHPGKDSKIVITDFGFSKIKTHTLDFSMTTWCGTPEYIAPELLKKLPYSSKVDIWALGVIVFVMLSGHLPFSADTTPKLFKQIMSCQYSYSKEVWNTVSDTAKDFIDKLLAIDPMERLDTIQASTHGWIMSVPPIHKRNTENKSSHKLNMRQRKVSKADGNLIKMNALNRSGKFNEENSEISELTWTNYMKNRTSPQYKRQRKSENNIVLPFTGDFQGNVLTKDNILGDDGSTMSPSNIDSVLATEDSNSQASSQFGMLQVYYYSKYMSATDPEEKRIAKEEYLNHMEGNELKLPVQLPLAMKESNNNSLLLPKVGSLKEREISVHDQFENIDEETDDGKDKSFDLTKLDRIYANQGTNGGSVVSAGSFKSTHIPIETTNASYIEKVGVWLNDSEDDTKGGKFSFNQDKYKISNSDMDNLISSRRTISIKSNLTMSDQSQASSFNRVLLPSTSQKRNNTTTKDTLKLNNGDLTNTHSFTSSISNGANSTTGLIPNRNISNGNGMINKGYHNDVIIDVPEKGNSFTSAASSFRPLILNTSYEKSEV